MRNSGAVVTNPGPLVVSAPETERRTTSAVPPGKRVLNTHISLEEHTFLKAMASKNSMTVTMFLRNLIRREMNRSRDVEARPYGT